jgi:hypothetical protein
MDDFCCKCEILLDPYENYCTGCYEAIKQENAKLKAQLENTRLGLEKIDNLITHDGGMIEVDLVSGHLILSASGINSLQAPTLADLIDKIALMEVE